MSGENDSGSPLDPGVNLAPTSSDLDSRQNAPTAADVETTNPELSPTREGPPSGPVVPLLSESYTTRLAEHDYPQSCANNSSDIPVKAASRLRAPEPFNLPPATPSFIAEQLHKIERQFDRTNNNTPHDGIAIQSILRASQEGAADAQLQDTEEKPSHTIENTRDSVMAIQSVLRNSQMSHENTKSTSSDAVASAALDHSEDPSPQTNIFAELLADDIDFDPSDHESHVGLESSLPFRVNPILNRSAVIDKTEDPGECTSAGASPNEVSLNLKTTHNNAPVISSGEDHSIVRPTSAFAPVEEPSPKPDLVSLESDQVSLPGNQLSTQQTSVMTDRVEAEKDRLEEKLAEAIIERNEAAREASKLRKLLEQPASIQLYDQDEHADDHKSTPTKQTLDNKEAKEVTEEEPSKDVPEEIRQKTPDTSVFLTAPSSPVEDTMDIRDPRSTLEGTPPAAVNGDTIIQSGDVAPQTTHIPIELAPKATNIFTELASKTAFALTEQPHPRFSGVATYQVVKKRKRQTDAQDDIRKVSFSRTGVSLRGNDALPRRFAGNGLYGPKPKKSRSRKSRDAGKDVEGLAEQRIRE